MPPASPRVATSTDRRRVLIVDDSAVARAVIARAVAEAGGFELAGAVPHVAAARRLLANERVDAILLDVDMPGVDGVTALPELVAAARGARVLIVSSACAEGGEIAVRALAMGAADTLVKPSPGASHARFAAQLVEKLARLLANDDPAPPPAAQFAPVAAPRPPFPIDRTAQACWDVIAIGASTGGIHALGGVLGALPVSMTAPILVTQHLPTAFMPIFAAQVATLSGRPCEVATDRLRLRPGRIVVAPGDAHVRPVALADGSVGVRLSTEPSLSGCLPSVDVMFEAVAAACGPRALGVVLSGMGRDGETGARALVAAGAAVMAQDRETSVVWGMPGAVAVAGLAQAVLPPEAIGRSIADRWRSR